MATIRQSKALARGLAKGIDGRRISAEFRHKVAVASFHLSLEHHRAIIELSARGYVASAFALLRPQMEGCLNGLWAAHLATTVQLKEFNDRHFAPKPDRILRDLAKNRPANHVSLLKAMYESGHGALDEFTHGGLAQLSRRIVGGDIRQSFPRKLAEDLLHVSNVVSTIAATQLADLTSEGVHSPALDRAIDGYFEAQA